MNNPNNKNIFSISISIRFPYITQLTYCQIFQRWWDPNKKKNIRCDPIFIGGVNHHFIILLSYWFSITTIKNAIVTRQKIQNCKSVPIFINWGSFSNREKKLIYSYVELPGGNNLDHRVPEWNKPRFTVALPKSVRGWHNKFETRESFNPQ